MKRKLISLFLIALLLTLSFSQSVSADAADTRKDDVEIAGIARVCYIKNLSTGRYLEVNSSFDHDGANSVFGNSMWTGGSPQKWVVVKFDVDGDRTLFKIKPYLDTDHSLYISNGTSTASIYTYPENLSTDNQSIWISASPSYPDYMYLRTKISTDYSMFITDTGSAIVQSTGSTYENGKKMWVFEEALESGSVYFIRNVYTKQYMDVYNGSAYSGANVVHNTYHGGSRQQWRAMQQMDGSYKFYSLLGNYILNVENASPSNGANIQILSDHSGNSGRFKPMRCDDGTYRLMTKVSSYTKGAVVQGANMLPNTNIIQYDYTYSSPANDQWELIPINNSYGWTVGDSSFFSTIDRPPWCPGYSIDNTITEYYLNNYNSVDLMKTIVNFKLTASEIETIVILPGTLGASIISHRNDNANYSSLSAYFVITNLPLPCVTIENESTCDNYYEIAKALAIDETKLIAATPYYFHTYWQDYRNGDTADAGYFSLMFNMYTIGFAIGSEFNSAVLDYPSIGS